MLNPAHVTLARSSRTGPVCIVARAKGGVCLVAFLQTVHATATLLMPQKDTYGNLPNLLRYDPIVKGGAGEDQLHAHETTNGGAPRARAP